MRFRQMATYRGVPYEVGVGPAESDVVLFAACPPPEELGFEPATGHWRKRVIRAEVDVLWESRPIGTFHGEACLVLDDLGDRLHIVYLGKDARRARELGYWQVDRGVFELLTPRDEVTSLNEEKVEKSLPRARPEPAAPPQPSYPYGAQPWSAAPLAAPAPADARGRGYPAEPALARDVLRTLEMHFSTIETALNYSPPDSIGVILYTQDAFADITRAPGWVGALNDGRIRVPVQGLTSVSDQLSSELKHELVHSFVWQKTRGRCPGWLNEGLAQWMEGRRSDRDAAGLIAAYEQGQYIPLKNLEGSWTRLPAPAARFAYAWSLAAVESIIATSGTWGIERLFDRFDVDPSFEAAMRASIQTSYADLERQTVTYLRQTYP